MNERLMNERLTLEHTPLDQVRSTILAFRATPLPLAMADAVPTSDNRDGHHNWSLYGNSGSQTIQSTGPFPTRIMDFYGTEGTSGPNQAGVSKYKFAEGVENFTANGQMTFPDGKVQKITGSVVVMLNGIQVWSGKLRTPSGDYQDTPSSAQYYITQTIKRQRIEASKFHLCIVPIIRAFDGAGVGSHKLRVYNDSTNALLQEWNLQLTDDPHSNMQVIFEISELVGVRDFLRVEVIAQIAVANANSNVNSVVGGSLCGAGFLDNVP